MQDLIKNKNIFIKTLGSGPKIRVGRVTVNIGFFFFCLINHGSKLWCETNIDDPSRTWFVYRKCSKNITNLQPVDDILYGRIDRLCETQLHVSNLGEFSAKLTCLFLQGMGRVQSTQVQVWSAWYIRHAWSNRTKHAKIAIYKKQSWNELRWLWIEPKWGRALHDTCIDWFERINTKRIG